MAVLSTKDLLDSINAGGEVVVRFESIPIDLRLGKVRLGIQFGEPGKSHERSLGGHHAGQRGEHGGGNGERDAELAVEALPDSPGKRGTDQQHVANHDRLPVRLPVFVVPVLVVPPLIPDSELALLAGIRRCARGIGNARPASVPP
jgi:hypothetical protein